MLHIDANGTRIPQIGFGTWPMKGAECEEAVRIALETGYRHIDTARMYQNEAAVGAAIAASPVDRSDVFVTTKIWPEDHAPDALKAAVADSLNNLRTESVDLLLLHWPSRVVPFSETLDALNQVHEAGQAKAIGISNFTSRQIDEAVSLSRAPLALNQVEYHPYLDQSPVVEATGRHGLAMTAYCPTAKGAVLSDPVIADIAKTHGRTPVQVALRWLVQQGVVVIPKSATPARIAENFDLEGWALDQDEMTRIHGLARPDGRIVDMAEIAPDWD